jgi:hypothetical protein
VYLAGVLVYNVLPLDLTISLVEIFHQWRDGKVNLIPFGRLPDDAAYALYEIATDALIWMPLALLWRLDGTRTVWRVWGMTLGTAVMLEVMQLFVYSRVSDVTDLFTAAAGAALGGWVGGRLAACKAPTSQAPLWSVWLPFALAAGWMAVLLFVFWFPFDFRTDGAFIKSRLDFVQRVRSRCITSAPNTAPSPKCCARRSSLRRSADCWRGAWHASRGAGAVHCLACPCWCWH